MWERVYEIDRILEAEEAFLAGENNEVINGILRSSVAIENLPAETEKVLQKDITELPIIRSSIVGETSGTVFWLNVEKEDLESNTVIISALCYIGVILGLSISATVHLVTRDGELPEVKL